MSGKRKPGRKKKGARKNKETVRLELKGELRDKFLYLMQKYGATTKKSLVAILIAEKYTELVEKENMKRTISSPSAPDPFSTFNCVITVRDILTRETITTVAVHPSMRQLAEEALKNPAVQHILKEKMLSRRSQP